MIQIIVLLYASKNGMEGLREFESKAIPILSEHKGILISASSNQEVSEDEPDEIHVIQFPSAADFEAYKCDPSIITDWYKALASLKNEMIRKMDVLITHNFYQY
ncbi:DUF1330 domain-containing protein [Paraglaciecola sp. L3A3]|uniref:DUF1330 domain-containing protein n=1 Tax=Paraglaciecola sp. L3A3 TaxID=2686358 RepID=UPI00131DAF0C|nr:DUF1330 domain-containing protein [Paraglaciecola sp. L3A3]